MIGIAGGLIAVFALTGAWAPKRVQTYYNSMTNVARVDMYGRVEAGDGQPLEGATVTFRIITPNAAFILGDDRITTQIRSTVQTGADGKFEIHKSRGITLYIDSISKNGYVETRERSSAYYFARVNPNVAHKPSSEKPQLFRMKLADGAKN
jgi:hypothetical protein